jgi:hypothetical protein
MTCHRISSGIVCISPSFRLPLAAGTRVYMDWHNYCGPTFYRDKAERRIIEDWYECPLICAALGWFQGRGNRA